MSTSTTPTITDQNSGALRLPFSIFFLLLALDAEARVRQRVQAVVADVVAAAVTLAERLGRAVQPAKRFVDVPEEATFLAREEERLLPLHGVGALIRHVE